MMQAVSEGTVLTRFIKIIAILIAVERFSANEVAMCYLAAATHKYRLSCN